MDALWIVEGEGLWLRLRLLLCVHTQHFPRDLNSQVRSCRTITAAPMYTLLSLWKEKNVFDFSAAAYISLAATVLAYGNVYLRNCRVGKRRDFRIQKSRLLNQATDPIMIEKRRGGNVLMLVPLSSWRLKRWRNNLDEIEIDRVSTYILDRDSAVCMLLKMIL